MKRSIKAWEVAGSIDHANAGQGQGLQHGRPIRGKQFHVRILDAHGLSQGFPQSQVNGGAFATVALLPQQAVFGVFAAPGLQNGGGFVGGAIVHQQVFNMLEAAGPWDPGQGFQQGLHPTGFVVHRDDQTQGVQRLGLRWGCRGHGRCIKLPADLR